MLISQILLRSQASTAARTAAGPQADVPEPLLKWPGGKRWLVPELIEEIGLKPKRYFEPFLGGAAAVYGFIISVARAHSPLGMLA